MKLPAVTLTSRGFMVAWAMYLFPMLLVSMPVTFFIGTDVRTHVEPNWGSLMGALIFGAVVGPAVETSLLIYPTSLAGQAIRRYWLACVVGSAPIVLLHLFDGWGKVIVVASAFIWSAHCYFSLTGQGVPLRQKFLFLTGIHGMSNAVAFVLMFAFKRMGI